ncbi:MAG: diaminopimelate epimerase [Verrucomicrobiales bacterium]
MLQFTKMNGAGNDFVLLDNRDNSLNLSGEQIASICDRHRGVGADGLLAVEPAEDGADFRMRYYNADGGEAEMCGNGARCFARYVRRLLGGGADEISFETIAGRIVATFHGEHVRIQLSEPFDLKLNQELELGGKLTDVHSVNTGVPHAVVIVDDIADVDIRRDGSAVRYHDHFAPAGTNANFMMSTGPDSIAIRTYERGVEDETLACGTGMVANAIIHNQLSGAGAPIRVRVAGGDDLLVDFERDGDAYSNVTLTGPADFVFEGEIPI